MEPARAMIYVSQKPSKLTGDGQSRVGAGFSAVGWLMFVCCCRSLAPRMFLATSMGPSPRMVAPHAKIAVSQNHAFLILKMVCLDPGSGRNIPAIWPGAGAYPRILKTE